MWKHNLSKETASKSHHLLSITNPTDAENTRLILAGYLGHMLEGCCFTHLDIYFLECEFNRPLMWGVVGIAHPWRGRSREDWRFVRHCSPFLRSNHQHPWVISTPFPPKCCTAKPCTWRVLWQQHDLQVLCHQLLTKDKSQKAERDLGFDPYLCWAFKLLWSMIILPSGFLGPNLQPLMSACTVGLTSILETILLQASY